MLRILFFILLVFALGIGFAWLAERPGDIVVTLAGYQYQTSLMVAAVAIVALVASVMILWWLLKSIWTGPHVISEWFRARRRDKGYRALSTGMIAAGSGDAGLARRKKKEALKLLSADREPLLYLLDAQASLLEGDHEAAREKFTAMLDDPGTRHLGLRGLYLEAERVGDRQAARHYAEQAAGEAPQLGWASEATLEQRTEDGEWDEALRLVDAQKATHQLDRPNAHRRKAVLLTAKAITLTEADPAGAKAAALEALNLAPDLVPAAVTAAKAAFRLGDTRKGAKVLEAMWKKDAHPEVAEAYVHARPGDSTHDRLERARKLRSIRQNNAESELAVARAALDAGEFAVAREAAKSALRMEPREGAYLLMADIEEAETGDQGMVREWLGRAVRAPRDPVWIADGYVSERWAPLSPVSGRLDAFEWRQPTERPAQTIEDFREPERPRPALAASDVASPAGDVVDLEVEQPPAPAKAPPPVPPAPETEAGSSPVTPAPAPKAPETKPEPDVAVAPVAASASSNSTDVVEDPQTGLVPAPATGETGTDTPDAKDPASTPATASAVSAASKPAAQPAPQVARKTDARTREDEEEAERLARMPDDPGVDPEEAREAESSRFRIF